MSPSYPYLGFDPGRTGAAALLDDQGKLLALVGWKPCVRNGNPRYSIKAWRFRPGEKLPWVQITIIPARPGSVGAYVTKVMHAAGFSRVNVACEDSYIMPKNPSAGLKVARFSGGVVAPAEELYGTSSEWVLPSSWRKVVLPKGWRKMYPALSKRDAAKAASLRYVPLRVPRLADAMVHLGEADHYTDAAGVADWSRTKPPE